MYVSWEIKKKEKESEAKEDAEDALLLLFGSVCSGLCCAFWDGFKVQIFGGGSGNKDIH